MLRRNLIASLYVGNVMLLLALAAFIVPNLPALSGWRRDRADAAAED
jgi:hypothetical protein